NRKAEGERLETEPVGGASVHQAEPVDLHWRSVDRLGVACLVDVVPEERRIYLRLARGEGEVLPLERTTADVGEEDPADATDHSDGGERRLDDRKAEFGIGEDDVLAGEAEVVVPAHFGVAAEINEVRIRPGAPETAHAHGEHAGRGEPLVVAD